MSYYRFMPRVAVLPWPGTDDCYVCISGSAKPKMTCYGSQWHGEKEPHEFYESETRSKPRITFCVHSGRALAEWDGDMGPITVWLDATVGLPNGYQQGDVSDHWFFAKAVGSGNWTQLGVDRAELPRCFIDGCYDLIFATLRRYAKDHDNGKD